MRPVGYVRAVASAGDLVADRRVAVAGGLTGRTRSPPLSAPDPAGRLDPSGGGDGATKGRPTGHLIVVATR